MKFRGLQATWWWPCLAIAVLLPTSAGEFQLPVHIDGELRNLSWTAGGGATAAAACFAQWGLNDAAQQGALIAAIQDMETAHASFACAPDCDLSWAATLGHSARAAQEWWYWPAPGGIAVAHLLRADSNFGGGQGEVGLALVRKTTADVGGSFWRSAPRGRRRCMEFCAGPAFIGFTLLGLGTCSDLVLAEVNPLSIAAVRETARINGLEDRVVAYHSNGLDGLPSSERGRLDLVVSNPPHFVSAEVNANLGNEANLIETQDVHSLPCSVQSMPLASINSL